MSKIILITGTSTGFGKLMTTTLANAGHKVLAGMRDTDGKNKSVAQDLEALTNVEVVDLDVTEDSSVTKAFELVLRKYGTIDILINNAGVNGFGLLEAYSINQIKAMFEVNFYGVIRTYQAVLPVMRKQKNGLIINITSGASGHTLPFMIPYLAAKFGVESITEGLQEELRKFNIENVSIQPGAYPTEMNNGSKAGIHADNPEIAKEYEPEASEMLNALGTAFHKKMAEYQVNPQTVADGVLKLVNMESGTRPLRYPLDAIAEGTDLEFINYRAEIKDRWLAKYQS
ncbi:SDR family oxidoreductase [Mucilaginibacter jinjuensis]|uniref:SDR family oxidoreductase n=1 Tax=Mucilaginibacter jinjuensis TaxID=1176721 RepID=A0ABY7TCM4_9SPHI|nr:SDR family oxidoreductase [Mucilaginibacter jinjuensis]WCT14264.1 SDR family oxidoreductase [Mucilaginibacter jinjuensis]